MAANVYLRQSQGFPQGDTLNFSTAQKQIFPAYRRFGDSFYEDWSTPNKNFSDPVWRAHNCAEMIFQLVEAGLSQEAIALFQNCCNMGAWKADPKLNNLENARLHAQTQELCHQQMEQALGYIRSIDLIG